MRPLDIATAAVIEAANRQMQLQAELAVVDARRAELYVEITAANVAAQQADDRLHDVIKREQAWR